MSRLSAERQKEIETARSMLAQWIAAERAIMASQEFRIGTKLVRYADLKDVRASVKFWKDEVARLEGRSRISIKQIGTRGI